MSGQQPSFYLNTWEIATAVDGPGTRLVFFFAGCPLRCVFCHNPETWIKTNGKLTEFSEVENLTKRYLPIFKTTNGGVTFIGGEVLFQADALIECLKIAKKHGAHTCVDTSAAGFSNLTDDQKTQICENTDLFLLDIKGADENSARKITRESSKQVEKNSVWKDMFNLVRAVAKSENKAEIRLRFVLVPDLTSSQKHLDGVKRAKDELSEIYGRNIELDILPFHQMAKQKYEELKIPYSLSETKTPTTDEVEKASKFLNEGLQKANKQ